ncbi:hypothetical protein WR25_19910 [Diploscapter pachys]|uniref:Uncharacterized protein n=1 Tax=Diploscapter pachys TaxID=2018661 RepID=A0A2A2LXJ3_9BILA|nr:hypothetical protein WR25_19910 [Diploscapter pachys]
MVEEEEAPWDARFLPAREEAELVPHSGCHQRNLEEKHEYSYLSRMRSGLNPLNLNVLIGMGYGLRNVL